MENVEKIVQAMDELELMSQRRLRDFIEAGMDIALMFFLGNNAPNTEAAENALALAISEVQSAAVTQGTLLTQNILLPQKSLTQELISLYQETYARRSARSINETTYQVIRAMLLRRQRNGVPIAVAAQEVAALIPGLAETRALLIARTETHSALQFASQQSALRSGLILRKRWNTVRDERVRDFLNGTFSHRAMDGQTVSVDHSFQVPRRGGGFESLLFPGDPDGSAGNIINCRCVQTYERVG